MSDFKNLAVWKKSTHHGCLPSDPAEVRAFHGDRGWVCHRARVPPHARKDYLEADLARELIAGGSRRFTGSWRLIAGGFHPELASWLPNDATLVERILDRHKDIVGSAPKQVAMDGGFASRDNLATAKGMGVIDVCFSKRKGMQITEMVRSSSIYKRLRRFRAGVESVISFLKRCFGLDRCNWSGRSGFERYVGASILSHNLLVMARHQLAP